MIFENIMIWKCFELSLGGWICCLLSVWQCQDEIFIDLWTVKWHFQSRMSCKFLECRSTWDEKSTVSPGWWVVLLLLTDLWLAILWGARDLKSFVLRVKKNREKLSVVYCLSEPIFDNCVQVVKLNALRLGFQCLVDILRYNIQISSPILVYFYLPMTNLWHIFCKYHGNLCNCTSLHKWLNTELSDVCTSGTNAKYL